MPMTTIPNARNDGMQNIMTARKVVNFGDNGTVFNLVTLPAGSIILKPISGAFVVTAFNAGTNNFLDMGTTADDDLFGTDLSLLATVFVPLDEAIGGYYVTAETTITATLGLTGTAATAGQAVLVICYIPPN